MSHAVQLLRETRFRPFFFTQFLGAFNDNVFKTALITLVAFHASTLSQIDGHVLATLLPGVFILPFFLFSATAGQLADKYEKSRLIRLVKLFEIAIMALASAGFFLQQLSLLALALFMMGMHSTLFGPVKYAYLPQHLSEQELIGGNGMVEMGSFVAILLGQVLGAWLGSLEQHAMSTSISILLIALMGYQVSRGIPDTPPPAPDLKINWNPITETVRNIRLIWPQQSVWVAIIGISWFWFYGATLLAQFPNYAEQTLHGNERVFILLLSIFSIGIGLGSVLCEKLAKGKVELGLVMFGALGMTLFGIDFWAASPAPTAEQPLQTVATFLQTLSHWRLLADIALIGLFGGFYIVPLYVLIQTRVDKTVQSRIIAANNIMNALFMVVSAGVSMAIFSMGYSIAELFLMAALLNSVVAVYLCWRQPEYLHAFIAWITRRS